MPFTEDIPKGVFAAAELLLNEPYSDIMAPNYTPNCKCVASPKLASKKRPAHRANSAMMDKMLAEAKAAEGPREPSTRTTCNRCGTKGFHWTGDKQAGTLVMRDVNGFVHECPTYGVQLNLGQPS